jgi:hypothetical protein
MANDTTINPLGWGILFFTFWLSIMTMPNLRGQTVASCVAWVSLSLSILMLISIEPHIRNWLNTPGIIRYILTGVFYITLLSYAVTYIGGIGAVYPAIRPWVIIIGFIWFMVFFCILISRVPGTLGIITFVIFAGLSIYNLITKRTDIGRLTAIYLGVIAVVILLCALFKPKWFSEISLI